MRGRHQGIDYKRPFRFLLGHVCHSWDAVLSEAVARPDKPDQVFWIVALHPEHRRASVPVSESAWFSGLWVDEAGVLRVVDPAVTAASLAPHCRCCTHTFNGKPFTRKYREPPGLVG